MIHMGKLVRTKLDEAGKGYAKAGALLGMKPSSVTQLLKTEDMKVSRMLELEEKLGIELVSALRPEWAVREKVLMDEAGTLKERVKELEMEVGVLNRVVGSRQS